MCGISLAINRSGLTNLKEIVGSMNDKIKHRGPDQTGIDVYRNGNLAIGHQRLAILDLNPRGKQPMTWENKFTIAFNGEIYNYIELRNELRKLGVRFKTETDTEVILASYAQWGISAISRFNGMWAFIIYDQEKNEIICSRDRFGIKPIYFHETNDGFYAASEIKQFQAIPGWQAKLNYSTSYDFLTKAQQDHTRETFFSGIFQLLPGQNMVYNLNANTYTLNKYYIPGSLGEEWGCHGQDSSTLIEQFRSLFFDSVRLRLRADVPIGTALSGGLDSSAITLAMHAMLGQNNPGADVQGTVTACFEDKESDERPFVKEIIEQTGLPNFQIYPRYEDLVERIDEVIWHQDEPFFSTSIFAQYLVFEEAKKQGLTVMVDGQGADEILAGYAGFYRPYFTNLLSDGQVIPFLKNTFNYIRLHEVSITNLLKTTLKTTKKPNELKRLRHFWVAEKGKLSQGRVPFKNSSLRDLSLDLLNGFGIRSLLHFEDRNSMAYSVESRVPFLDYRLVEFALALPDDLKINQSKRKFILREALNKELPKKIKNRYDKMGFFTPQDIWMKRNGSYFRTCIENSPLVKSGMIDKEILADFDKFIGTKKVLPSNLYWRIFILGQWMKKFNISL